MRFQRLWGVILGVAGGAGVAARGAVVIATAEVSGDLLQSGTFDLFNPALGTLNEVIINFEAQENPFGSFENTATYSLDSATISYSAKVTGTFFADLGSNTFIPMGSVTAPATQTFLNVPKFDGTFDLGGPSSMKFTAQGTPVSTKVTYGANDAALNFFKGTVQGTLAVSVEFSSRQTVISQVPVDPNGTQVIGSLNSLFSSFTTIEYHYTPVPEPDTAAALAVLVAGGGMAVGVRRAHSRRS